MIKILATGGNGQLAQCLKDVGKRHKNLAVDFQDLPGLDITNQLQFESYFLVWKFDYCLKYTACTVVDLAKALIKIVLSSSKANGLYHFSNFGVISWYDFAVEIFKQFGKTIEVKPIKTKNYPTAAKRPKYSVLDTRKIKKEFKIQLINWKNSLDALKENKV